KVIAVDVNPILDALKYKFIPVITPLAMDFHGQTYNINADTAACEIAMALKARKLVFLSDVPGILRDPKDESTLISVIHTSEVDGLISEGVLSGGMLPKIQSSVNAIKAGTKEVHMIDGRTPHSLLLEIFTNSGIGTEILEG
ncbi:MAG: acetylglutamate kinase, partial [Lentisphaeria bacterium]|nr:acetylglutamate kinase [Lentisphaeria bacterium]